MDKYSEREFNPGIVSNNKINPYDGTLLSLRKDRKSLVLGPGE